MGAILRFDAAILLFFQEHVRVGILSLILSVLTGLADHGILCIAVCVVLIAVEKDPLLRDHRPLLSVVCLSHQHIILKNLMTGPGPMRSLNGSNGWHHPVLQLLPLGHACACLHVCGIWKSFRGKRGCVRSGCPPRRRRFYEGDHYPQRRPRRRDPGHLCP
jgi:hypothetical protein